MLQDAAKNKDKTQAEDFIEGFKVFDKEQNGLISTAELRHLLTNLGKKTNRFIQTCINQQKYNSGGSFDKCDGGAADSRECDIIR